jgi:MoaA/NifB/PqqE/SkfB family radical SAM enzyme
MPEVDLDTYCSYAFTAYDTRNKHICCKIQSDKKYDSFEELSSSEEVRELRNKILAGEKDPKCYECWNEDSVNKTSMRKWSLRNKTIEIIQEEIQNPKLKHYILDTGNACNLACRTCGPWASSTIVKERKEKSKNINWLDVHVGSIKKTDVNSFCNENFSNLENIDVLGGEPLSNLEHFQVLSTIIDQGHAAECLINYSTNGTIKIGKHHLDMMLKFKQVFIMLSYDAVGKPAEYIRTGSNWNEVSNNLENFKNLRQENNNISLECHPTISALNILYIEELFDWLEENNIGKFYDFCYYPHEYSFQLFTPRQKEIIINRLEQSKHDMSSIIAHINKWDHDPTLVPQFWNQVQWTKEYWKLDIKDYLPDLYSLMLVETNAHCHSSSNQY